MKQTIEQRIKRLEEATTSTGIPGTSYSKKEQDIENINNFIDDLISEVRRESKYIENDMLQKFPKEQLFYIENYTKIIVQLRKMRSYSVGRK